MPDDTNTSLFDLDEIAEVKCGDKTVEIAGSLSTVVADALNEVFADDPELVEQKQNTVGIEEAKYDVLSKIKNDLVKSCSSDAFFLVTGGHAEDPEAFYNCVVKASDRKQKDFYLVTADDIRGECSVDRNFKSAAVTSIEEYIKYRNKSEQHVLRNGGHVYRIVISEGN